MFYEYILVGCFNFNKRKTKQAYIINPIMVLAKFHIHISKFANKKTLFYVNVTCSP